MAIYYLISNVVIKDEFVQQITSLFLLRNNINVGTVNTLKILNLAAHC